MSRALRVATLTVALCTASAVAAASAAAIAPPPATPPTATTGPVTFSPPARAATPAPTSRAYRAPVRLPSADVIASTVTGAGAVILTLEPHTPAITVGRVVVVTPPKRQQLVAQVTAVRSTHLRTVVTAREVSAMAALAPGGYIAKPNLSGAVFTTPGGAVVNPRPRTSSRSLHPDVSSSYTLEFGPYTETVACDDSSGHTGSLVVTADVKLTPSIEADADLGWFSLHSATLAVGLKEEASLTVKTTGPDAPGSTSCTRTDTLGSVSVPVDIGPLVASVKFSLFADLTASLQGTVTASADQTFSGTAGVHYDGNSWTPIDNATEGHSFQYPAVTGANTFEADLRAEASVSFYDVITGKIDLSAGVGLQTQLPPNPTFSLFVDAKLTYEIDVFGYKVTSGTLWSEKWVLFHSPVIDTVTLPVAHWSPLPGRRGMPPTYSAQLAGDGGYGTLTYRLISGTLPDGVSLSASGLLSGTPTPPVVACTQSCPTTGPADDDASLTVQVTDSIGLTGTRTLVLPVESLRITSPTALPSGTQGVAWSPYRLAAHGAVGSTQWTVIRGDLPPLFTLSAAGVLTGTPQKVHRGTYTFTVEVSDAKGATATQVETITITGVSCGPSKPGFPPVCS